MKPYPFWVLNHFTVPTAINRPPTNRDRPAKPRDGSNSDEGRKLGPALDRERGRAGRTDTSRQYKLRQMGRFRKIDDGSPMGSTTRCRLVGAGAGTMSASGA